MNKITKIVLGIVAAVLLVAAFIYFSFKSRPSTYEHPAAIKVEIIEKWELPMELEEVSGIAWIDDKRVAAIQDEDGIIFIYDLNSSGIEQEIPFGDRGDYEGITLVDSSAYVLRSDGVLFEVANFLSPFPITTEFQTGLQKNLDAEGLSYDPTGNRLLIAVKDYKNDNFKPVFAFNLNTKKLEEEPALKIDFHDPVFLILDQRRNHKLMRPSEINIHPLTGEYYILEGVIPKLLILDARGKSKKLLVLDREQFPQAEGLTFSPNGDLYISNESNHEKPNILKVDLDE
ncbi:MAG TPA: SdiA-regulated domain-containing protein [Gillisia sp.]|nr:SdiA-regulated domain-containing protein [Gillisia sp.]